MTIHRCEYRVIYGDTDGMGIVYHANYLRMFEKARTEFFRDHLLEPQTMIEKNLYMVVVKAFLHYHSPAVFDDLLTIASWMPRAKIRQASFHFDYLITHKETGRKIVSGYTQHALTTRDGKLKRMPPEFGELLASHSDESESHSPSSD